ncbi:hypothetical protein BRD00_14520 [Halobacteriales archaeon QS_8_69_26]|nr:MAG: hypothetical protein BRD00_14520 [Halobacteriales archaeon QS_8_69_26]
MPTGIDVDASRVVVATPAGTSHHHNGVLRVEDADEDALSAETDHATYLIGSDAAGETGDPAGLDPLIGGESNLSEEARRATVRAFVTAMADEDGPVRDVTRPGTGADPLDDVLRVMEYDAGEVDAGLAVCHDVFEAPVTGLGVAIFERSVTATVAVGGIAVGSATVDATDDWYNYGRLDGADEDGLSTAWATMQYETLFADLAAELAGEVPSFDGSVPVAVGGDAAPDGIGDRIADALAEGLPVEVGEVTVADDPGDAPARGALAVAESAGDGPTTTPAYARDVPHGSGPTDPDAVVSSVGGGVARSEATAGTVAGPGRTEVASDGTEVEAAVASAHEDLSKLERRSAKTARALSELIGQLDDISAGAASLSAIREDLDELEERLGDEAEDLGTTVERLESQVGSHDEETTIAETLADLESTLSTVDETVDELEDETVDIRSAVAELDGDIDADFSGPMEEVAELQDDIDALEKRLEEQMDYVWEEIEELSDELVDVAATVEDVPELEAAVAGTQDSVTDLEGTTQSLQESLADVREELSTLRTESVAESRLEGVESELDNFADKLERLRREVDESEDVDPERIDELETTLDGLRKTMISQGERIDALEDDKAKLDDRIDTVYQNSAKAEALSSLETEVSRIRQTAAEANDAATEMESTVRGLSDTVDSHQQEIATLSTNVDNLAGSAVTRNEVDTELDELDERIEGVEIDYGAELDDLWDLHHELAEAVEGGDDDDGVQYAVILQGLALVFVGILGGILAFQSGELILLAAFIVLVVLPGAFSWMLG